MSFDNKSIIPAVVGKPHIVLREGFWRVSPTLRPTFLNRRKWDAAYQFIHSLNFKRSLHE